MFSGIWVEDKNCPAGDNAHPPSNHTPVEIDKNARQT